MSSAFSPPEQETDVSTFLKNLKQTEESASTFGNALIWVSDGGMLLRFKAINSRHDLPDFSVRIDANKPVEFITPNNNHNRLSADDLIGIPGALKVYISTHLKPSPKTPHMALSSQLRALALDTIVAQEQPSSAPVKQINQLDALPPLTRCQQVVVWGLEKRTHLNGRRGIVTKAENGDLITVKLIGCKPEEVPRINLIPYKIDETQAYPLDHERQADQIEKDRKHSSRIANIDQVIEYLKHELQKGRIYNISGARDPYLKQVPEESIIQSHACVQTADKQSEILGNLVLPFNIEDIANAVETGQFSNGHVVLTNIFTAVPDINPIASKATIIAGKDFNVFVLRDSHYCRRFIDNKKRKQNEDSPNDPFHVVLPHVDVDGNPVAIFVKKYVTDDHTRMTKLINLFKDSEFEDFLNNLFFEPEPSFDKYNPFFGDKRTSLVIPLIVKTLELKPEEFHYIDVNTLKAQEIEATFKANGFSVKSDKSFANGNSSYEVDLTIFTKSSKTMSIR